MRTVGIAVAILVALGALTSVRAAALPRRAEFCPARVAGAARVESSAQPIYAFALRAESVRTVSGSVDVQTDAGWFQAPFTSVALRASDRRYRTSYNEFTRRAYVSDALYVRFPVSVHAVRNWWAARPRLRVMPSLAGTQKARSPVLRWPDSTS